MPWKENLLLDGEHLKNAPELFVSFSLPGIPEIQPGDDIGGVIAASMDNLGGIVDQDIFVVASKIVSKSEGAIVDLSTITPSQRARELSAFTGGRKRFIFWVIPSCSKKFLIYRKKSYLRKNSACF